MGATTSGGPPPLAEPRLVEQEVRDEGAYHVLGAMREVDDVEKPEDDREPQRKEGVERAVDQADQELTEECLGRHRSTPLPLLLHQLATAVGERTERLLRRDRREDLVVVV